MKIKLEVEEKKIIETEEGEEVVTEYVIKSFSTKRMRGRALKRMLEIQDVMKSAEDSGTYSSVHFDLMCEFICEMFDNKFTSDDLLDGIELTELYPMFKKLNEEIAEKTMKKLETLTKN